MVSPYPEIAMPKRRVAVLPNRGRDVNDAPRKPGWQVPSSVADAVRRAVDEGAAASQNAFVERALVRELRELRRRRMYDAYAGASKDRAFAAEMEEVTHDFETTASDGLADRG